jgi:phage tail-like protein
MIREAGSGSFRVRGILMSSRGARRCGLAVVVLIAAASIGVLASPGLSQTQPSGPLTATRFALSVDGIELASFSELAGITSEVAPTAYLTSADKTTIIKKLPSARKPPTVVLKRGMTGGIELFAWHDAALRGNIAATRKDCTLTMYGSTGEPLARYFLTNAWPFKLEIGGLKAGSGEPLTETVTLTADRIQRVSPT